MRLNIGRFAETASPDVLVALEQRSIGEIGKSGENVSMRALETKQICFINMEKDKLHIKLSEMFHMP